MNKNITVFLALLAGVIAFVAPAFALEADYIPMTVSFPAVTLDAASETVAPFAFIAPENITVKSVYVTEADGVTANATDTATFTLKDDGSAIQSYRTNGTNLVAMTPRAFTLVTAGGANRIAKGSLVTVAITKQGAGVALTTPVVQLNYTIGW